MAASKVQSFPCTDTNTKAAEEHVQQRSATSNRQQEASGSPEPNGMETFTRLSPDILWDDTPEDDDPKTLRYSYCRRRRRKNHRRKYSTKQLTEDTKENEGASSALQRFKQIALKVKIQVNWKKRLERTKQLLDMISPTVLMPPLSGYLVSRTETPTFRVNAYTPRSSRVLSLRAKFILMQPPQNRTVEELKYVNHFTIRLSCFGHYPIYVRQELTKIIRYETIPRGNVVIREGDVAFGFFYILTGSVCVQKERMTRRGSKYNMVVGEIKSGGAFGELALIHNDRRRATIVCKQDCEFLKINKPDFEHILKKNYQHEWNTRLEILNTHPLFQSWHPTFIKYAVEGSSVIEYPADTLIVKDLSLPARKVYFLIQGSCHVVQRVSLLESTENRTNIQLATDSGKKKDIRPLLKDTSIPDIIIQNCKHRKRSYQPAKQRTTRWWVVYTLQPGNYFGIGEGSEEMSVVTKTRVELLEIGASVFKKYDSRQMLYKMHGEASMLYPSQQEALKSYLDTIRWNEYKQKVLAEAVQKGKTRKTNYSLLRQLRS